jgi:uncharacterized membrane protein
MEFLMLAIVILVGYPALAHAILSRGTKRRIAALEVKQEITETEVRLLRAEVLALGRGATAAAPKPAPASQAVPVVEEVPVPPRPVIVPEPAAAAPVQPEPVAPPPPKPVPAFARAPEIAAAAVPASVSAPRQAREAAPAPRPRPAPLPPAPPPAWLLALKTWMFSGNLVAKMGLLILFIGVSFLLKYVAERVTVPIELRLAGIVLADIALLAWGWRIRETRRGVGLPVQGTALGILMLVTFGAFRIYHLIPSGMAFGTLFALTMFTCLLAVMQDAFWLAVFGITGGFAAPILTSTGQGSHIGLFSYYALLNAGILAIALKRTWRTLNLIGFAFTFIIGTAWGVLKYSPDTDYLSTQLFLGLFFVFYVALALLYAWRQQASLKNYVDATLVFGTPLIGFGLQLGLMRGVEFGNAWSAIGLGLFYTALAVALWRRRGGQLRMLVESFLALGVVFGTLAIPFALDGRWTSAAWALEGAALAWIGLRQRQKLVWSFGLLLQAGACVSFLGNIADMGAELARGSHLWLGFLILGAAALLVAYQFRKQAETSGASGFIANGLLAFAAIWLTAMAWFEIGLRTSGAHQANLFVASGLAVAVVFGFIASRLQWQMARALALLVQLVAGALLLVLAGLAWDWGAVPATLFERPLIGAFMIAAGAFFTSWNMQRMTPDGSVALRRFLLVWAAFWWFGPILDIVSGYLVHDLVEGRAYTAEGAGVYWIGIALSALASAWLGLRLRWPDLRWLSALVWPSLLAVSCTTLWTLYADDTMPVKLAWAAYLVLWAGSELLVKIWPAKGWTIGAAPLRAIHTLRTVGPWLLFWKAGEIAILRWLGTPEETWSASGSWANYLPAWVLLLSVGWLVKRSAAEQWPVAPVRAWYRRFLLPAATLGALLVVLAWNLHQDGSMAPLPYLPLLNPLDLTTAFAILLGIACSRMMQADAPDRKRGSLPSATALICFAWANFVLLRTAAHFLHIPYHADALYASQFVQAMLSLVWSVTALVLMRLAAQQQMRRNWIVGAVLLGAVVGKLFLVDLSSVGSMARIVSFVGVGLLMVLIGYLAPFPTQAEPEALKEGERNAG